MSKKEIKALFDNDFWRTERKRAQHAYMYGHRPQLLTFNPKVIKGRKKNYQAYILHLAPSFASGYTMCGGESLGCAKSCLNTSGRGALHFAKNGATHRVQHARLVRTFWFQLDRVDFMNRLAIEISNAVRRQAPGLDIAIRLNGTSDVLWERISLTLDAKLADRLGVKAGFYENIMKVFPKVQFYDYTKISKRGNLPRNYDLTYSLHESNEKDAFASGLRVAVVFKDMPKRYHDRKVLDGDDTDLRFLEPKKAVIGLKAKGQAKHDTTGFVK